MTLQKSAIAALQILACSCVLHIAQAAEDTDTADVAALKAEIAELKSLLPTQAHVMADVDYNFSNLWFAARQANWPLANFYMNETRGRLNWALRLKPVRKLASGQDIELKPMLQGMEQSGLTQIKVAIEKRSSKDFEAGYREAMAQCLACHVAIEKPFLKPHIPTRPASAIIDMQP